MSVVTNVILAFACGEKEQEILRLANEYEDFNHEDAYPGRRFVWAPHSPETGIWYGGDRCLEVSLLIGAFNHLNTGELLTHLAGLPWQYPERVQFMAREDEGDRFSVWRLYPAGFFAPETLAGDVAEALKPLAHQLHRSQHALQELDKLLLDLRFRVLFDKIPAGGERKALKQLVAAFNRWEAAWHPERHDGGEEEA